MLLLLDYALIHRFPIEFDQVWKDLDNLCLHGEAVFFLNAKVKLVVVEDDRLQPFTWPNSREEGGKSRKSVETDVDRLEALAANQW